MLSADSTRGCGVPNSATDSCDHLVVNIVQSNKTPLITLTCLQTKAKPIAGGAKRTAPEAAPGVRILSKGEDPI